MPLRWRRSRRAEDRLEKWISQQHQRRVLAGETTPSGPCPDEAFLRALARRSRSIVLSDPRVDHAASCPACMSRLLILRSEYRSQQRKMQVAFAGAACLILIASLIVVPRFMRHSQPAIATTAVISKTVNLWDVGTVRGEQPAPLQSVLLPAARVRLTIILPRFSQTGQYLVAVTRNQSGTGVVAEGTTTSVLKGGKEVVSVELNLAGAKAGAYFLATTHEQDQAAYYYPLQIR